jgi:hypothetical protein
MRSADARSAEIDRPEGVTLCFHVSVYKVEPSEAVLACNLLANDDWRAALADEPAELRPEVALVVGASLLSGVGEGLAGTTTCPDGAVVRPPCKAERVRPDPNTRKEVDLMKPAKVFWLDIVDAPVVDCAIGDQPGLDEFAQPRCREGIVLVVISTHSDSSSSSLP